MSQARSFAVGAAGIGLALLLGGCGTSSVDPSRGGPGTATSTPPSSAAPAPASSAYSSKLTIGITDADNGKTVTITRGTYLTVVLNSTYWQFHPASAPAVLAQAPPAAQGSPPSAGGVPGSGRGTARDTYHARAAGTATITATRSSCGEAMRCTAAQSLYRVTVVVR